MWRSINYTMPDPHPGSLQMVEIHRNGVTTEIWTEPEMVQAIFDENQRQILSGQTCTISHCSITDEPGLLGFTPLGEDIVAGKFTPPPDLNEATSASLIEIGVLGKQLRENHVNIEVQPGEFSSIWSNAQ